MPTKKKLSVLFYHFVYSGNSGGMTEISQIRKWATRTLVRAKEDPRISEVHEISKSDTPITMVRNEAILRARQLGVDVLVFIDSDNDPILHENDPWFKPFFETAFDKIYDHYDKGPLVIGAPYCGPPDGTENVYVFYWENNGIRDDSTQFKLEQYPRQWAAQMSGIQECAALPTGLIMFDMRIFDLMEPSKRSKRQVLEDFRDGKIDIEEAQREITEGWFYYEWKDGYAAEKASTEDVTFTRDASLIGMQKLGYNPVMCAWDSWVGHVKPWNVGKPSYYGTEQIGNCFKRAVLEDRSVHDRRINMSVDEKVASRWDWGGVEDLSDK